MQKTRIEWIGGMKGHLAILLDDPICFNASCDLEDFLFNNYESDEGIHFEDEELEMMGVFALFMAIRERAPYERGHVLDNAVGRATSGSCRTMSGYGFMTLPWPLDYKNSFNEGCRKLATYLEPIKVESQYSLKCVAFDYIQSYLEQRSY